ncbi:MAG: sigma-70 domain-containing protein [Lachnospiraceae bacterium]
MQDEVFEMYLEELNAIKPCDAEEVQALCNALAQGKEDAKARLIEGCLFFALKCAREFEDRGLPMGDLIQEANMALTLAVDDYEAGDFFAYLETAMKQALTLALEEQSQEQKAEEEVLARVNVLKDISQMMAEELGREATVEELAERMRMTVEEIRDIMKLTLDAMSVMGEE